jgi:hypothetical protein
VRIIPKWLARLFQGKELKVSLSGNLGFVSLDEVLRLLTRSNQRGAVNVSSDEIRGRIFITKGGISLATTSDDAGMHRHLVKSGLVDEAFLRTVEDGDATLEPIVERSGGALTDLLREMTVESIYQLGMNGDAFEVKEGVETVYASPQAFDLEGVLEDSKQRLTDWTEVSKTVSDLQRIMRIRRDLGDREQVSIDRDAWRVLSEIGSGSSVADIADRLGTTDFWTARISARLVGNELVSFNREHAEEEIPEHSTASEETWEVPWTEPEADEADPDRDRDESWWQEPGEEASAEAEEISDEPVHAEAGEEAAEHASEAERASIFGAYAPAREVEPTHEGREETSQAPTLTAEAEEAEDVEEDTEAFLEKVFSELETTEEEPEEEGYGLLRRRRLGAIRDNSSDA